MQGLVLNLNATYFFYRIPYNSLLMDSLPFPPKTSIVGMFGAAIGWDEEMFIENIPKFKYGLIIENPGERVKETVAIFKNKDSPTYPITKNIYYKASYRVFVGAEDEKLLEEAYQAMKDPKYAITLGDSDNIFYPKDKDYIKLVEYSEGNARSVRCILPSDVFMKNKGYEKISDVISPPTAYKVPVNFNGTGKKRRAVYATVYSYSGISVKFNDDIKVYFFEGEPVYLF
jgi:CRISPR-associated protein Cas5h